MKRTAEQVDIIRILKLIGNRYWTFQILQTNYFRGRRNETMNLLGGEWWVMTFFFLFEDGCWNSLEMPTTTIHDAFRFRPFFFSRDIFRHPTRSQPWQGKAWGVCLAVLLVGPSELRTSGECKTFQYVIPHSKFVQCLQTCTNVSTVVLISKWMTRATCLTSEICPTHTFN